MGRRTSSNRRVSSRNSRYGIENRRSGYDYSTIPGAERQPSTYGRGFRTRRNRGELENTPKYRNETSPLKIGAALVGGLAGLILCEHLYYNLLYEILTPVLVAMYLVILAFCITFPVLVISFCKHDRELYAKYQVQKHRNSSHRRSQRVGHPILYYSITLVTLFLATMLFDFIYELNFSTILTPPTSYTFALDMSGSMSRNDSQKMLQPAVESLVANSDNDFPFAIYSFRDKPELLRPMNSKAEMNPSYGMSVDYDGGTDGEAVLRMIIEDYHQQKSSGTWKGGANPKVLLMTDGDFETAGMDALLDEYVNEGIVICTIGMHGCREGKLLEIADKTGGVFIRVRNASKLDVSMKRAATNASCYNLLSERFGAKHDILCKFLRILFMLLLGLFMFPLFYFANGVESDRDIIMVVKVITSLISAILLEMMLRNFGSSISGAHFVYTILTAIALLTTMSVIKPRRISPIPDPRPTTEPIEKKTSPTAKTL